MPKLSDVCRYIRSKNAGPFWITIDLFFKDDDSYHTYKDDPALQPKAIAGLYGAPESEIRRYMVDALNVVKISYPRNVPQGGMGERDMHGGQQYVPLLDVTIGEDR